MIRFILILSLLTLKSIIFPFALYGQSERTLTIEPVQAENLYFNITDYLEVLTDSSSQLKIEDVKSEQFTSRFVHNEKWLKAKFKTHWLRLTVKSNLPVDKELLAYIQGSIVELYDFTRPDSVTIKKSGLLVPLFQRNQQNWFGHFPYISILLKRQAKQTFYWKVNTTDFPYTAVHTNLPSSLSSFEYVLRTNHYKLFLFISVCSILFGLSLYYFSLFVLTKDRLFVYAGIYSLCACAFVMYYKGFILELIIPSFPKLNYLYGDMLVTVAFLISTFFLIRYYFELSKWVPVWYRFLKILIVLKVALTIASAFFQTLLAPSYYIFILLMFFLECIGIVLVIKKHPLGKYYLSAFTVFNFGLISNALFALFSAQQGIWDFGDFGLLGLNGLLAVGLANRINMQREELEIEVLHRTQEIKHQNEILSRLNLLKNKLFSVLSHDIRGPMNQLASTLYMVEKDALSKEEISELIPSIRKNIDSNTLFLQELLIWAKSQFEGAQLNQQSIVLKELTDINFELLKPLSEAKKIILTNKIPNEVQLWADREMIKLVLRNLISNAIKFTSDGGQIEVSAQIGDKNATVFVKDNGIGMNEIDLQNLFNLQMKTKPGTANEKGTGVGLLICKDFIEKNGGKIWAESQPGKGTTFAFTATLIDKETKG